MNESLPTCHTCMQLYGSCNQPKLRKSPKTGWHRSFNFLLATATSPFTSHLPPPHALLVSISLHLTCSACPSIRCISICLFTSSTIDFPFPHCLMPSWFPFDCSCSHIIVMTVLFVNIHNIIYTPDILIVCRTTKLYIVIDFSLKIVRLHPK